MIVRKFISENFLKSIRMLAVPHPLIPELSQTLISLILCLFNRGTMLIKIKVPLCFFYISVLEKRWQVANIYFIIVHDSNHFPIEHHQSNPYVRKSQDPSIKAHPKKHIPSMPDLHIHHS